MNKNLQTGLLCLLGSLLFSCGGNNAETQSTNTETEVNFSEEMSKSGLPKVEINEENAQKYLAFLDIIRKRSPEWERKMDESAISALAALLTSNAELESIIKEAGFKNREEFYAVAVRIQQVLVSLQNDETQGELQEGSQKALEEFDKQLKNPDLDENTKKILEAQREQMKKSLEEYQKTTENFSAGVTQAERNVLKALLPKLQGNQ
jgi:hypothetical protein